MVRHVGAVAVVVLAVLAVLAAAGCASEPSGPPDPFPPRPEPIEVMGIDPCRTLTPEQLASRGLDVDDAQPGGPVLNGAKTYACGWWELQADYSYSVQMIPQDAATAVGTPKATVGAVAGYGTVRITDRETTAPLCEILVDVTEGQLMRIQVQANRQNRDGTALPIAEACRQAESLAADALGTARALVP